MRCGTVVTKCRLCGEPFEEELCVDDQGVVWNPAGDESGESASPWCPVCLGRMNQLCDRLCAGIAIPVV